MNSFLFPATESSSTSSDVGTRSTQTPHPWLWLGAAFAFAIFVFAVAVVVGTLLPADLTVVEIEPGVIDPFSQQKMEDGANLAAEKQAF